MKSVGIRELKQDASRIVRQVADDGELAEAAARLAADHGLRGADSLYVAVAKQLGLPLATWDRDQARRAAHVVHSASIRADSRGT